MGVTRVQHPTLNDLNLNTGKRTRLHRLLYKFGPANGTLLFLPIDQGLEHGPRDFFPNPDAKDPEFQLRLAKEGNFSGIVYQIGVAEKYMGLFAGEVPLVLKLNGKTEIPSDQQPISPLLASVEDAVRLGADAVGYTLYIGSPMQAADFAQFRKVREDAEKYGMPIIVWAYPRGEAIDAKGGRDSLYAIDYARSCRPGIGRGRRQDQHAEAEPGEGSDRAQALQHSANQPGRGGAQSGRIRRTPARTLQRRRDAGRGRCHPEGAHRHERAAPRGSSLDAMSGSARSRRRLN